MQPKCNRGKVVTLGNAAAATGQMSQFFSARGLSSFTAAAAATAGCVELCRAVCGNFQLSQTLSFQQRRRRRRTVFDTPLDCSHSDHNMDGTYRVTSDDNFGDFDIDNMTLTSNCHVRPMP